jgi:hypothetical protein
MLLIVQFIFPFYSQSPSLSLFLSLPMLGDPSSVRLRALPPLPTVLAPSAYDQSMLINIQCVCRESQVQRQFLNQPCLQIQAPLLRDGS